MASRARGEPGVMGCLEDDLTDSSRLHPDSQARGRPPALILGPLQRHHRGQSAHRPAHQVQVGALE